MVEYPISISNIGESEDMLKEWTINTILNRLEDLTVTRVCKYNKQECINSKSTLQAGNEELKEYNCTLQLHTDFCHPKKVIDILKKQQESREPFEWIYRAEYKGSYVIERFEEQEVTRVKDLLIYARVNFNLIEVPQNSEFEQQKTGKADLSRFEQYSENSNRIKDFAIQAKNSITENLKNSVMNLTLSENLTDAGYEVFEQVKNGVINDISDGAVTDIYDSINKYSEYVNRSNLETREIKELITGITSLSNTLLKVAI